MTRHSPPRFARCVPFVILAGVLVAGMAATLAACGSSSEPAATATAAPTETPSLTPADAPKEDPTSAPSGTPTNTTKLSIYFLRGAMLGVAERRVPRTKAVAAAAMRELCRGPTATERSAGLDTAIPAGTEPGSISISDGIALVDLSSHYADGGGSQSMMARVAQVVYTLTRFPSIKAVSFSLDGSPISTLGEEGLAVAPPQRRADWVDFEPTISVESPGVGATLGSPFVLAGTASVFEGSFTAELRDDSGRRIVRSTVQASKGGPERGDFRKTVAFTTSAPSGLLIVYTRSMEDGSRQNEVRIPVAFTR